MKANADFRSRAGLDTYIERRDDGKCCEWCSKLAGRYSYPDSTPRDVFRRHDNCGCTVEYVCSKGRQNVWSKRWASEPKKIEYSKPTVLTPKEAEELEKRLTNERKSGIIKAEKDGALIINMQFFANKNIPKMTDNELKKSIRSWQQRIDEHKAYINNPITHCDNWEIFDERYQFGLIRHWEHEIKTMQADIDAAIKELERRGSL